MSKHLRNAVVSRVCRGLYITLFTYTNKNHPSKIPQINNKFPYNNHTYIPIQYCTHTIYTKQY